MLDIDNKKSEKSAQTRKKFMETFCLLYTKKPIEKISISELCKKAGYNRCTFYEYYLNLDDILHEIENETVNYFLLKCKNMLAGDINFISELHSLYQEKKYILTRYWDRTRIMHFRPD